MTKTKAKGPDYSKVTPALVKQVKDVIADGDKHRYSVSAVYDAYNTAFEKRDTPQTCSSCLRNRVRELRKWLEGYEKYAKENAPKTEDKTPKGGKGKAADNKGQEDPNKGQSGDTVTPQYEDPDAPGYVPQVEGTVRYPMTEGIPFDFLPNEGTLVKGTVTLADGTSVTPGVYVTAEGLEIAVQPDGTADIKVDPDPQYEDPEAPGFVAPAEGVIRIPMAAGLPFDLTPSADNPDKGAVKTADGKAVMPGTYKTATGDEIAVQVGSKATYKKAEVTNTGGADNSGDNPDDLL